MKTKSATIISMLNRANGVSMDSLMKATGWQRHSVRGFLSGTLRKVQHLKIRTVRGDNGTVYSIAKKRVQAQKES